MDQMTWHELSDFWWLPEHIASSELLVGVGHHHPLTDDENPCSVEWFHSVGEGDELSHACRQYPLNFLKKWQSLCNNTNVYRTLELFTSDTGQSEILGPFLVDIDNTNWNDVYEENLRDALLVTRRVMDFLSRHCKLRNQDRRLFFSGRKGFNIEVRPQALGIDGPVVQQIRLSAEKLQEIINHFGTGINIVSCEGTNIDRIYGDRYSNYKLKHPYIRLYGSWNKWGGENNIWKARSRIELSLEELMTLTVDEICARAERLK
jgi:hypothetical protein